MLTYGAEYNTTLDGHFTNPPKIPEMFLAKQEAFRGKPKFTANPCKLTKTFTTFLSIDRKTFDHGGDPRGEKRNIGNKSHHHKQRAIER